MSRETIPYWLLQIKYVFMYDIPIRFVDLCGLTDLPLLYFALA